MTWLDVLIISLAAFRLTRLVAWDEISQPVRAWVSGVHDANYAKLAKYVESMQADGHDPWEQHGDLVPPMSKRRWYVAKLLHCPWCVGWWIALAVTLCAWWRFDLTVDASYPLALSAVIGIVAKNLDA